MNPKFCPVPVSPLYIYLGYNNAPIVRLWVYNSPTQSATSYWWWSTEARPGFHSNASACVGKQPIMVATASTEHSYWLALAFVANASACVSCGFRLRNARNARSALSDCVWMETGLYAIICRMLDVDFANAGTVGNRFGLDLLSVLAVAFSITPNVCDAPQGPSCMLCRRARTLQLSSSRRSLRRSVSGFEDINPWT